MITYKSTRGDSKEYTFSEAILKGIAEDGGLLSPVTIPMITLEQLQILQNKSYQERALFVLEQFQTDLDRAVLKHCIDNAYRENFDNTAIAPIVQFKQNQYFVELWHGPTAAFKDMALQLMPHLFSEAIEIENNRRNKRGEPSTRYIILTATSGDTGKAALEGYKNKKYVSLIVFYPKGRVSQIQEKQMTTQEGSNVMVYAVQGNFDDVQTLVKRIFTNRKFTQKLYHHSQVVLSSANSINWGRLLPQIVYHIHSYLELVKKKHMQLGDPIDIAVPTGNFGNILAAYYAKRMGIPIRKLICASNENNVVTEFLQTGVYTIKNRKLTTTPSPSMDILISSNIERLLSILTNDSAKVARWMQSLQKTGVFHVDDETKAKLQDSFVAGWVSNADCLNNIYEKYKQTHYLMDPHTSVAQLVAETYLHETQSIIPVLIASTAHWAKFVKDIYPLFDKKNKVTDEFAMIQALCTALPNVTAPHSILDLQYKKQRFTTVMPSDVIYAETLIEHMSNIQAI